MGERIAIDGGPTILVEGRPAQGVKHEVAFGVIEETGKPAVVKFERIAGALERETMALEEVGALGGPVPRVLGSGTALVDGESFACLVTERRPGEAPTTADGWRRMGRAFGRLSVPAAPGTRLPILDHAGFGEEHARRARELGARLEPLAAAFPDWERLVSAEVPENCPLVLTHGDAGPGNFLDDGGEGTAVDWEDAIVAPRGLDLARLVIIALLGGGPVGFEGRDHRQRADAAVDGYLDALGGTWAPSESDARWWTTVGGLQYVHRRWQTGGPGPWEDAVDALRTALSDGPAWARRP